MSEESRVNTSIKTSGCENNDDEETSSPSAKATLAPPSSSSIKSSPNTNTHTTNKLSKRQVTVLDVEGVTARSPSEQAHAAADDSNLACMSFLLCLFDNIVGPRIVHHWLFDARQVAHIDEQLLKYVAVHTLNGELYQDKLHSNLKFRFYLIQEIDRAIFSVFFDAATVSSSSSSAVTSASNTVSHYSAADLLTSSMDSSLSSSSLTPADGNNTAHMSASAMKRHHAASMNKLNAATTTSLNSLSIIVPLERKDILLKFYGDATRFFLNALENIVLEFKIYAHIKPKVHQTTRAIENLTHSLAELVGSLVTLRNRGLYPAYLSQQDQKSLMDFKIHIKDTYLNDCYFTTPLATSSNMSEKQNFLINAITSHLITNYRTIVVGKSSASINKLINTLGLFMPKELLRISSYALEENSMLSPYFCLQGFVTETPEDLNSFLTVDFLFKRDSPTTIIDLSHKQVYRTPLLNEFLALKEDFIKKKVKLLYNSITIDQLRIVYPIQINNTYMDNPLKLIWISSSSIAQKSTLITSMLRQMDILEIENGTKDAYLSMIIKDIYMLSVTLIEYVNNEISTQAVKKSSDSAQHNTEQQPFKLSTRKLFKELDIKSDEDLLILIAHANYLKPGFSLDFNLSS